MKLETHAVKVVGSQRCLAVTAVAAVCLGALASSPARGQATPATPAPVVTQPQDFPRPVVATETQAARGRRVARPVTPRPATPGRALPSGKPGAITPNPRFPGIRRSAAPIATAPVPGKPWLVWTADSYDFGRKTAAEQISGKFALRNDGEADLHVTGVRASCGCTVLGGYDKVIKPGQVGTIAFKLDGNRLRGKVTKTVTVQTDCPGHPRSTLRIVGEVYRLLEIKPSAFCYFGSISKDDTKERTLELIANTDELCEIVKVESDNPAFTVRTETVEKGKKFKLIITTKPPFKNGTNIGKITVTTNLEKQPIVTVRATATMTPRIRVAPTTVYVAPGVQPREQSRIVRLVTTNRSTVKIEKLEVSNPAITAEMRDNARTNTPLVQLLFAADYKPSATGDVLTIYTDDKEFPKLEVPIKARAARRPVTRAGSTRTRAGAGALSPVVRPTARPRATPAVRPAGRARALPRAARAAGGQARCEAQGEPHARRQAESGLAARRPAEVGPVSNWNVSLAREAGLGHAIPHAYRCVGRRRRVARPGRQRRPPCRQRRPALGRPVDPRRRV